MIDFTTYQALTQLYADYAAAIDSEDWDQWVSLFSEECEYKVQPRENYERGFPLCTLALISRAMLKDRVYGITETLFHDPYYQRHVVGLPRILKVEGDVIEAEANYAVFRTKLSQESTVFSVGRYLDRLRKTPEGLKFESRLCIYDTEMIPNSIIYPI
ncbi:aromatic-ring-hydroxylating dioxygenase subunit beta [Janthinobacterium sp. 17J80-10]|uniref:aromatic-ring-hydroxylating dioxygenase subunit beta n=1 Tax=Janthinobacterium sp. 17J80-10 TaxID=2497863 RepID=UPI00100599BE|nr:aromatic-ring-hydroxylating dioxygenase subunit beta [Janthinobacterium sp. 17J80-10]QAU35620.1 salicylate hydroxylase [Janthinobacterium sp. 17J80-10]